MAPRKQQQVAAVRIGYETYLVPASNAAKLIDILSEAITCDERYGQDGFEYTIGKPIQLEYKLVRPSQIRRPAEAEDAPITTLHRIPERTGVAGLLPAPKEPLWSRIK